MAKITNDNNNATIEIATDEDVYIPVASTQSVGVAKFNSNDFAVSQDGLVTSLQKVGGVQYMGTIVSQRDDGTLKWQLSDVSDDNTDYPRVGAKIMLLKNFEGTDRIHTAGEVYVITSVENYNVTELTPVYTGSDYLVSYKGTSSTVEVNNTTTLAAGSKATVENVGTDESVLLDFGIPGSSTIEVSDTVIPLAPATTPIVENVGTEYAAKLQFSIPTTQKLKAANFNMLNSWEDGSIEVDEENSTENELVLDFNIPRGYPGQSFHIDDQVYTISDLPAASEANIGRVYVVGESIPYDMYVCIYDEETSSYQWLNLGHLVGIKNVDKSTSGYVDTYTVTMDDGYTFQFTITNGAAGSSGAGIKSVTEYYLVTTKNDGVTIDTDGWDTNIPTIDAVNRYLWNYEHVEYTDGTTTDTEPILIGVWGVGITDVVEYYALSTSSTIVTGSWKTYPQTITSTYRYLWNYEVIKYEDGSETVVSPHIIGVYGDTGAQGEQGEQGADGKDGEDGEDGVGISSIVCYYLVSASSSGVTINTSGWSTTAPTLTSTYKYMWSYSLITYTDNSKYYTTPIVIGTYGEDGADGADGATIWTTDSDITGSTFLISDLVGPDGATPAVGDIIISNAAIVYSITSVQSTYVYAQMITRINGAKGDTITTIHLYHTGETGTEYTSTQYSYSSALTAGWSTEPSGVTASVPYEFILTFTETITYNAAGEVKSTSYEPSYTTAVIWAKYGADGDAAITAESIYNQLTENDTMYGCFYGEEETDDDGNTIQKLYIKAEYIKGTYITSDISWTGNLIATNIDAEGGTIGPFTINSSYLNTNDKPSYSSTTTTGVYLGDDGIGLGKGTFYVTSDGYLYSTSGSIGGFIISSTSLIYSGSISLNGAEKTLYLFKDTGGVNGTFVGIDYDGLSSQYRIAGGTTEYPYEMLQVYAGNGLIEKYYSSSSNGTENSFHLYLDPNNNYLPTLQGYSAVTTSTTSISYNFYVASNLCPTNTMYSIGTSDIPWNNIYASTLNFVNDYNNINILVGDDNDITNTVGYSTHIGISMEDCVATYNTLIGYSNRAYATCSTLIGCMNSLMYDSSTNLSIAYTVVIGSNNYSYDRNTVVIGYGNTCKNAYEPKSNTGYNVSIGSSNLSYGIYNVSVGYSNSIGNTNTIYTGCTVIGVGNACTSNYEVRLGYSGSSSTLYIGGTQFTSDERDKTDIQDYDDDKSLEFILSLRTVSYVDNARIYYEYKDTNDEGDEIISESHFKYGLGYYDTEAHAAGTKKGSRRRSGVLAQDVTEQMENVFGDSDYVNIVNDSLYNKIEEGEIIPEGIESNKTVSYTSFIPFLISAMRAQQKQIEALQEAINNL